MKLKSCARLMVNKIAFLIGAKNVLKIEAKIRFNKSINFKNPTTLSDKICYLEFEKENPLIIQCSDKYEVRAYVESKGLKDILVPLIGGVYNNVDEIDFDKLPNRFALKATYGCQMNLICSDKEKLDINIAKKEINKWLSNGFNRDILEPHYEKIEKRLICEKYLENADDIIDYKVHCLNGKPEFILVCSERSKGLKLNVYDLNWNELDVICGKYINAKSIEKPSSLDRMIEISKKLSEDFDFTRVDLYQIEGKIYFGELTFTPDGGMLSYYTKKFDKEMGEKLIISR